MCKFEWDYLMWWIDTHMMVVSRGKKYHSLTTEPIFFSLQKIISVLHVKLFYKTWNTGMSICIYRSMHCCEGYKQTARKLILIHIKETALLHPQISWWVESTALQHPQNKCFISLAIYWLALHLKCTVCIHGAHSIHKGAIGKKIKLRLNLENKDFLTSLYN